MFGEFYLTNGIKAIEPATLQALARVRIHGNSDT
jgi:hypothetical protein